MCQINKDYQKRASVYWIMYSIITFIFLAFLLLNIISVDLSQKKQNKNSLCNRKLQIEINKTDNETSIIDTLSEQIFSKDAIIIKTHF